MVPTGISAEDTSWSFPHSWWVPLMEQELPTLPEHLNSLPVFSGVCVTQSLVLCVMFCRLLFVLFLLAIVLTILVRFTDSDYPFGICKLFFLLKLGRLLILYRECYCRKKYWIKKLLLFKHFGRKNPLV
jgi:hypothetical protein